jgi:hypothetical protein
MQFTEIVIVYCDNHTEHANTLRGQNLESQYVKAGGIYSNHLALKGLNRKLSLLSSLFHPPTQAYIFLNVGFSPNCTTL